jgi:hypothetical protein
MRRFALVSLALCALLLAACETLLRDTHQTETDALLHLKEFRSAQRSAEVDRVLRLNLRRPAMPPPDPSRRADVLDCTELIPGEGGNIFCRRP